MSLRNLLVVLSLTSAISAPALAQNTPPAPPLGSPAATIPIDQPSAA